MRFLLLTTLATALLFTLSPLAQAKGGHSTSHCHSASHYSSGSPRLGHRGAHDYSSAANGHSSQSVKSGGRIRRTNITRHRAATAVRASTTRPTQREQNATPTATLSAARRLRTISRSPRRVLRPANIRDPAPATLSITSSLSSGVGRTIRPTCSGRRRLRPRLRTSGSDGVSDIA